MSAAGRPLCVLSVGRSGSSLATGVLGALGYELGPDDAFLPPDSHNERGYFELREMNDLNDEILATLGGSLWSPPPLEEGWHRHPEMRPFVERARDLVARLDGAGRRWAFKDTRTIWTMALWREVIGEMDYVLCVRSPREVVASLAPLLPDRDHDDLVLAWVRANARALQETAGRRRLVLRYDDWFADPAATAERLAAFAGVPLDDAGRTAVTARVDPRLRHQRADAAGGARLPVEALTMDAVLSTLARGDAPAIEALAATLGDAQATRMQRDQRLAADRDLAREEAAGLRERIARLEREVAAPPATDTPAPPAAAPIPLPVMVPAFPSPEDVALLRSIADDLAPWLQGPFPLGGDLEIAGAWRCDVRWGALAPLLGPLTGERTLDVGANAGFDSFMLRAQGAGEVLGIERHGFYEQAVFLEQLYGTGVRFERIGWQALDPEVHGRFDVVHCGSLLLREPHLLRLLLKLRAMVAEGGRLLLGTVVADGPALGRLRFTGGPVAGDPTWWWVPDAGALDELLAVTGFAVEGGAEAGDPPIAPFACSARYVLARATHAPSEELLAADLPAASLV